MGNAVMKGLRFADTQELCFEAWKRSNMACSAMLCGRFADSQKSCFQASKRSNMGSAVVVCGRSPDIRYSLIVFSICKTFRYGVCRTARGCFFDSQEWQFQISKFQIIAVPSFKRVDFLMFTKSGFRVPNVEICEVLSSNEVNLLMLRNNVFRVQTLNMGRAVQQ